MAKPDTKRLVTVSSVREANTRIISRDSHSGRFLDATPSKSSGFFVKSDISAAGKVAMKSLRAKK